MNIYLIVLLLLLSPSALAQDFRTPFKDCNLTGSITIYDYRHKKWIISDQTDDRRPTLPASTFKIINLLIALETGVITDEHTLVKWPGSTDTTLYGYRPDIYKDLSVKEAFEVSAGWAFIELAKKIGREKYKHYLTLAKYGNGNLAENGEDFWNFGPFGISPHNQVLFLIEVFEGKTPFSKRNVEILKKVMINPQMGTYTLRAKTGWTRVDGLDLGWWVGYIEQGKNTFFFATRVTKPRSVLNPDFGTCRKRITKAVLQQLGIL
ncbi:class D beta-lactamase [Spirosoma foliorum]|uniref:beta-lactamase n=1 Tax=Spirosoma foliorum TaxID=2710596 RepID=A0A7G5GUF1_9BACT|nr:class D beta-lactamase [Spirosoma foliorum]QMW02493.1 class D beta-lactamase [Spirosoma foliorum]